MKINPLKHTQNLTQNFVYFLFYLRKEKKGEGFWKRIGLELRLYSGERPPPKYLTWSVCLALSYKEKKEGGGEKREFSSFLHTKQNGKKRQETLTRERENFISFLSRDNKHLHAREREVSFLSREITNTYTEREIYFLSFDKHKHRVWEGEGENKLRFYLFLFQTLTARTTQNTNVLYLFICLLLLVQTEEKKQKNTKKCSLGLRLQLQEELYGQEQKQANGYMETRRENWGAANMVYKWAHQYKREDRGGEGREKNFIFLSFLENTQTTPRVREEEKIETLFILLTNTHSARVKKTTTHNKHARDMEENLRERIYFSFLHFHTQQREKIATTNMNKTINNTTRILKKGKEKQERCET